MSAPRLSALVVAHDEAAQLADCLAPLRFADEIVVVCDRCTDGSAAIARAHGATVIEGAWPIEGDRRNTGIAACTGDWIVEVDADERLSPALAQEIRAAIAAAAPGYFLIPFDNYVGTRLVRYGLVNGLPGFVTREPDGILQTTAFLVEEGRVAAIYVMRNPDKLKHLESGTTP